MRGRMVVVWHPDSPGHRVVVWRPWYKRKRPIFATLSEVNKSRRKTIDRTFSNGRWNNDN